MTRILLLGGTGDALQIARRLGPDHVYSLAGLGKVPTDLACTVRVGGFGGADGLARYLDDERIGLLVDATHPYAARMSANAFAASRAAHVPCWALRRPAWQPQTGDNWRMVDNWAELTSALTNVNAKKECFILEKEWTRFVHEAGLESVVHRDEAQKSPQGKNALAAWETVLVELAAALLSRQRQGFSLEEGKNKVAADALARAEKKAKKGARLPQVDTVARKINLILEEMEAS